MNATAEITSEIEMVSIFSLFPSPQNDELYHAIDPANPGFIALVESIKEFDILEPLVVTEDNFVFSGHRRLAGAKVAGLTIVPCRRIAIRYDDDPDAYLRLLMEYNRQREKTFD